jgi:hypothetical protein
VTIEPMKTIEKKYFLKLKYEARLERKKEMTGEMITDNSYSTVPFFQRKIVLL